MGVPDPGDGWRLVDVTMEGPLLGAEFWSETAGKWVKRGDANLPYALGMSYRVPQDRVWVSPSVLGLPNVPVLESDEYEPESYEDRVASSRMVGQVLFGAVCFFAGGIVGWITSLLCSWLLN